MPDARVLGWLTVERLSRRYARSLKTWDERGMRERLSRLAVAADQPWRRLTRRERTAATLALALAGSPRLVVLDNPELGSDAVFHALRDELRAAALEGVSILVATPRPEDVETIADGVSILRSGSVAVSGESAELSSRFRRIRYRNEVTAERTQYGNELDEFDAVQVHVRGWGVEAVVSNFNSAAYDRFQQIPGIADPEVAPVSLSEIFEIVSKTERTSATRGS